MKSSVAKPGGMCLILIAVVGLLVLGCVALSFLGGEQFRWALYATVALLPLTPVFALSAVHWKVDEESIEVKQYFFSKKMKRSDITSVEFEENLGIFQGFGYNTDGASATMLCGAPARARVKGHDFVLYFSIDDSAKLKAALE